MCTQTPASTAQWLAASVSTCRYLPCLQAIDAASNSEETLRELGSSATSAERAQAQRKQGAVLVNIAKLRAVASSVYSLSSRSISGAGDVSSWAREWRHLEADLIDMTVGTSATRQARIASRVHRTYLVFRA
jgi:hypothetical protein